MKFFQLTQENFALLGMNIKESQQKYRFFSGKILIVYSCYCLTIASFCAFLRREAHSFPEYLEVIFRLFLPIAITICFTAMVFEMESLFGIFNSCEKIVDKSEQAIDSKFIKLLQFHYSIHVLRLSCVQSSLQQSQSSNWKMDRPHRFLCWQIDSISIHITKMFEQPFCLRIHRFESEWRIGAAIPNVVTR